MPVASGTNSYFVKIDGIVGESKDVKHKDEIDVESWSWGETYQGSPRTGGGGGAGRVSMQDLLFTTKLSKASPRLFLACASGEHFKTALLSASRGSRSKRVEYLKITLSDVIVSSYQISASAADRPAMDQVSLNFAKIEVENPEANIKAGWDVTKNQKV
jgi:type VI secretion system secreted protein Hcp